MNLTLYLAQLQNCLPTFFVILVVLRIVNSLHHKWVLSSKPYTNHHDRNYNFTNGCYNKRKKIGHNTYPLTHLKVDNDYESPLLENDYILHFIKPQN